RSIRRTPGADQLDGRSSAVPASPGFGMRGGRSLAPTRAESAPLPGFRLPPSQARFRQRVEGDLEDPAAGLLRAFTPTQPKKDPQLFAGRRTQIERVIRAIEEEQASVILYGERGFGKTSLSNVVAEQAREAGYLVVRCTCSADIGYENIFRTLFAGIPGRLLRGARAQRADGGAVDTLAELLPEGRFGVIDVSEASRAVSTGNVILVLDEFDRITDRDVRSRMAETIKSLADQACPINFLVLGVANDLADLIDGHTSIQRHIVGVRLPLMSAIEIDAAIDVGEEASGLRFGRRVREAIVTLSGGMPYAVQLLCLYAGRAALRRDDADLTLADLEVALRQSLDDLSGSVAGSYEKATRRSSKDTMERATFGAASSRCDIYGRFSAEDVEQALASFGDSDLHALTLKRALARLTTEQFGGLLEREIAPSGETLYRFRDQMTRLFVFGRQAQMRGLL
ncbi:MAG: AAA family ATPase, partial [Deinococcus-Thermus bacterium]|nr:AAA family ATPase [Deinococcota bacterium]